MRVAWCLGFVAGIALMAQGCGDREERQVPTQIAISAADLDVLEAISGTIVEAEADFYLVEGDERLGNCSAGGIDVPAGKVRLVAEAARGIFWELEEEVAEGTCKSIDLSLGNPTSGMLAVGARTEDGLPLQVSVGGDRVGEIRNVLEDDDLVRHFDAEWITADSGVVRRLLFEFESEGKAALFIGPAGLYDVEKAYAGGDRSSSQMRLNERARTLMVLQKF